jgi:hypothetical protein
MMSATIVAIDLGQYKSVACAYRGCCERAFRTLSSTPRGAAAALPAAPTRRGRHRGLPAGRPTPAGTGTAVAEIRGGAVGVRGEVTNLADLDRLDATVKERHRRVDVLFAGVAEIARSARRSPRSTSTRRSTAT